MVSKVNSAKNSNKYSATGKPNIVEIAVFKLKSYGSLLKRELSWFEEVATNRINAVLPLYKLAKKISQDKNISEDEALIIVKNLDDSQYENILYAYSEDLAAIKSNTYSETDFNADIATMFLQSRVSTSVLSEVAEQLFEDYGVEYNPELGWTTEDTENLPMGVIEEICQFVMDEKDRKVTLIQEADTEITLGK